MCSSMCTLVVAIVAAQVEFLNSYRKNSTPMLPIRIPSLVINETTISKYSLSVTRQSRPQIYE